MLVILHTSSEAQHIHKGKEAGLSSKGSGTHTKMKYRQCHGRKDLYIKPGPFREAHIIQIGQTAYSNDINCTQEQSPEPANAYIKLSTVSPAGSGKRQAGCACGCPPALHHTPHLSLPESKDVGQWLSDGSLETWGGKSGGEGKAAGELGENRQQFGCTSLASRKFSISYL